MWVVVGLLVSTDRMQRTAAVCAPSWTLLHRGSVRPLNTRRGPTVTYAVVSGHPAQVTGQHPVRQSDVPLALTSSPYPQRASIVTLP